MSLGLGSVIASTLEVAPWVMVISRHKDIVFPAVGTLLAEMTLILRPPKGREEVTVQLSRLLHAHEIVLKEARTMARLAAASGDDGTNDLIVSGVIRRNELQVWFVAEHLVNVSLTSAE